MANQKYPRAEKLKRKTDIDFLFQKGKWRSHQSMRLIFLPTSEHSGLKIGVSVSKRNFKRAVDRNRIKRLLREVYRLNRQLFTQAFGPDVLMMIFYQDKKLPENFARFEQDWKDFLVKMKPAAAFAKPDNISPENARTPLPDAHSDTASQPSEGAVPPEL